jgi:hypothetical protein
MKSTWKKIYPYCALPFRLIIFIFGGSGEGEERLAGRYTRPAKMADIQPSADYLIG